MRVALWVLMSAAGLPAAGLPAAVSAGLSAALRCSCSRQRQGNRFSGTRYSQPYSLRTAAWYHRNSPRRTGKKCNARRHSRQRQGHSRSGLFHYRLRMGRYCYYLLCLLGNRCWRHKHLLRFIIRSSLIVHAANDLAKRSIRITKQKYSVDLFAG